MDSPADRPVRRLAAVWFADLVGYTRLSSEDEDAALRLIPAFQEVVRREVGEVGGQVVKFIGDGALAHFASTEAAVRAALAVRREVAHRTVTEPPAQVRIGVHLGDIATTEDGDIYGDGVNLASRLQAEARPGQVLVSGEVWRQLRHRRDFVLRREGMLDLRGIPAPVEAFGVELRAGEEAGEAAISVGVMDRLRQRVARRWTPRPARVARPAVASAGVVGVGLLAALLLSSRAGAGMEFADRDWLLITDCENLTGDPVFDGTLETALTTGLRQSTYVNIFPRGRVQEVLQRMGREPLARLDETVAVEVAQRDSIRAVLGCTVGRIGNSYSLVVRIIDPREQQVVRSVVRRVGEQDDVLQALDEIAREVRAALGESLPEIQKSLSLPWVTTPSLPALKDFAEGSRAWKEGRRREAVALWELATEKDSAFAFAHSSLALYHYWNNDRPQGEHHMQRALALQDRLSERERLWIRAMAASTRGDYDAAITAYRIYLRKYRDDADGWYNLGDSYFRSDRCTEALALYDTALVLNPNLASAYLNSATCHVNLEQFDRAFPKYEKAFALRPEWLTGNSNLNHELGFAYVRAGQLAKGEEIFRRLLSGEEMAKARGYRSLALLAMYRGRFLEAEGHLREAIVLNRSQQTGLSEMRNRLLLAGVHEIRGQDTAALAELDEVWRISQEIYLEPGWLLYAGKRMARAGQLDRAERLLELAAERVNAGNQSDASVRGALAGELALAHGRTAEAVQILVLANEQTESAYVLESLARALLAAGDTARAREAYTELVASGSSAAGWEAQEGWLLGHLELAALLEATGDVDGARRTYRALLALWKDADPDLPPLLHARERLQWLNAA